MQEEREVFAVNNKNKSEPSFQKEVKKARKEIVRSLIFAFAALAVLIIACFAWFTNNTKVLATTGYISASGSTFELASVGKKGEFDDVTPTEFYKEGEEWSLGEQTDSDSFDTTATKTGTRTELNSVVQWRLTADRNIGNGTGNTGIVPGSSGKLQFYVIPKVENLTLTFNLKLLPFKEDSDGKIVQFEDTEPDTTTLNTLSKLINGHIMFFYQQGDVITGSETESDSSKRTWIPCNTGEFTMNFSGKNPQLVTLCWEWPHEWNDIDSNIQSKVNEDGTTLKAYFFYSTSNSDQSDNSESNSNTDAEDTLYNNADMFIGKNAAALLVQLFAQP